MSPRRPLTDDEAHALLHEAAQLLASGSGVTVHAETALRAAEKTIYLFQLGLIAASDGLPDEPIQPPS